MSKKSWFGRVRRSTTIGLFLAIIVPFTVLSEGLFIPDSVEEFYSRLISRSKKAEALQPNLLLWATELRSRLSKVDFSKAPPEITENMPIPYFAPYRKLEEMTSVDEKRIEQTSQLYIEKFGINTVESLLWTGIEPANPLTRDESYRWNSLRDSDMYNADRRRSFATSLLQSGIRNVRTGLSNHEIDLNDQRSWREHDVMIHHFSDLGLRLSLDMHHFGIEDQFRAKNVRGQNSLSESYYLHPDWPAYFGKFTGEAFRRYSNKIEAITLINEPEPTVGFNAEMWHGGYPGWGNPKINYYYIRRAVQVGKAAVLGRMAIEKERRLSKSLDRPMYMHTEATVYKPYWEDFNRFIRFLPSDMILGSEWLLETDFSIIAKLTPEEILERWENIDDSDRTTVDWLIQHFIVDDQSVQDIEKNRDELVRILSELQSLHLQLVSTFETTMKDDTVFAVDYYAQNEDKGKDGKYLVPEPDLYAQQVISGNRAGVYAVMVDYFNRYRMPLMIGETGTVVGKFGSRWSLQVLLECAQAHEQGIPFLGLTIYPAIDTWGWETALSVPKSQTLINPSGLYTLDLKVRPFVRKIIESLSEWMQPNQLVTSETGS